jgi:hypothetical protein
MNPTLEFRAARPPRKWKGRYSRIAGKEPAFHVSTDGDITVVWYDKDAGEKLTASMLPAPAASQLARALNQVKSTYAGCSGGSFAITEFGEVACPIRESLKRYFVGWVKGVPHFQDPRNSRKTFNLKPDPRSQPGAPWRLPYLGMPFNLGEDDEIYFKQEGEDGKRRLRPNSQDQELIRKLRKVRPSFRVIRFIVNLHGAVFTRVEPNWRAVFVGYIAPDCWFEPCEKQ